MTERLGEALLNQYKPLRLLADVSRKKIASQMIRQIGLSELKMVEQLQQFEKTGYMDDAENIKLLQEKLEIFENGFIRDRPKKWIVVVLFTLLGLMLGQFLPKIFTALNDSLYSREDLDNIMQELLGGYHIKDALTKELLIVAYDYNGQEPRFFSKWFSKEYNE